MEATTAQQEARLAEQRRIALTQVADGLFQVLRTSEFALEHFGLACASHSQGRTGDDVGFASAWLVACGDRQMLAPLRVELGIIPIGPLSARMELSARLMSALQPYDESLAILLAHRRTTIRAVRQRRPMDAALLYEQAVHLLGTFPAAQVAHSVHAALAH
jgi:hypothetical protein